MLIVARAVSVAVVRSIGLAAGLVAVALAVGQWTGGIDIEGALWCTPFVFVVAGIVHELGHVVAIHGFGGRVEDVRGAGTHVRVTHRSLGRGRDIACVVAGPVAALVLGGLLMVVAAWWGQATVAAAALLIGIGHAVSLALPVGDGRQLRRLCRGPETGRPRPSTATERGSGGGRHRC